MAWTTLIGSLSPAADLADLRPRGEFARLDDRLGYWLYTAIFSRGRGFPLA
jgi:hypothetical protein